MRYLAALQNAIITAKSHGEGTLAAEADNFLASLKNSDLTSQNLDDIRLQIIEYILAFTSSSHYLALDQGIGAGFYTGGSRVTIAAKDPQTGLVFDKWIGDTEYLSDANAVSPILVMPSHSVTLTATYTSSWYNINYLYRKQIIIDHTQIANTDQTDFPVLVSFAEDNFRNVTNGGRVEKLDGSDIMFVLSNGTSLSYEIESYNSVTGDLIAWVKMPTLSHVMDTYFYMYYGNSNADTNTKVNINAVWDSRFKMVQHMNGTATGHAGDYMDSTQYTNDSTNDALVSEPTQTMGRIGNAQSFDGANNFIDAGDGDSLNITGAITVETWVKFNNATWGSGILSKTTNGFYGLYSQAGWVTFYTNGISPGTPRVNNNQFYHIVGTYDGNSVSLYQDGVLFCSAANSGGIPNNLSRKLYIGRVYSGGDVFFSGLIDEVRISDVARSADWIKTEYNNQSSPETFFSLSSQESYLDHYTLTGNNTQKSGEPQTLTLTAYTYSGDIYTAYTGDKTVAINRAAFSNNHISTFTDKDNNQTPFNSYGVVHFSNGIASTDITLYGTETITATDGYCNNTPSFQVSVPNNSAFIPPAKPSLADVNITILDNGKLTFDNLPDNITQIAISTTPDFKGASWEDISKKEELLQQYNNTDTLYIKFRTQDGASSDTIVRKGNSVNIVDNTDSNVILLDGDIVKSPSSPDVYVITLNYETPLRASIVV